MTNEVVIAPEQLTSAWLSEALGRTVEVISIHATPPLLSIGPFSGVMARICR